MFQTLLDAFCRSEFHYAGTDYYSGCRGFYIWYGGTALVAKTYGAGEKDKANRYFSLFVYARSILIVLPFFMLQVMFQSFFVAAEKPKLGLAVTVFSGITNMLLPMFWGITGVWISVVAAEFMAVMPGVIFLIIKRKEYHY